MIISMSVENWMSFHRRATLSMVASKERQHGGRLAYLKKYQTRVLPVATIYGGNSSGKTNLFKALNFARMLVIKGTQPEGIIPVEPFRLDPACARQPSRFGFELLIQDTIYEFSFAATRTAIEEEKLVQISGTSEKVLYHRKDGKPNFHHSFRDNMFLQFAFQGTRDNQLFLTNSVNQKVDHFKPVYDWFKNTLDMVAPDSRFEPFEQFLQEDHPLYPVMNDILSQLDTGITHLGGEDVLLENLGLPESFMMKLREEIPEGSTVRLLLEPFGDRIVITRKGGDLLAKKLVSYHQDKEGREIKFEIRHESDGTRRVIDLVPAFLELMSPASTKVFVIDEIDRSLHSLLTRQLLERYLASRSTETRSQLLFTTHDALLMDQKLFRRDEMWVAERDQQGNSSLFSLSEYKDIRFDKDIRKSYLQGRLGGIPRIISSDPAACRDKAPLHAGEKR